MLQKTSFITLISSIFLSASSLDIGGSWGYSPIDMVRGEKTHSVLINPATLNRIKTTNALTIDLDTNLAFTEDTLNFIQKLESSSSDTQEVSSLMEKNIGKVLSFSSDIFIPMYREEKGFKWLLGFYNSLDGYFITHSGFGSKGAMESYIEKYRALVGTFAFEKSNIEYGFNIKAIEKLQTIHAYSIGEIIETDSFMDYFDNEYTQKEQALAFDAGVSYLLSDNQLQPKLALSILNMGDTSFNELGSLPSTTNIGLAFNQMVFNTQVLKFEVDYIDLFAHQENSSFEDSLRLGMSSRFFDNSLHLSTGILYQSLTFGIEYNYSIFNIALNSYVQKIPNHP
ncbi:MAG: hypothetical protein K0U38_09480, partial [Epsilonproteobacteria bacterium]|nr:hypothetical protein [Campylobacterota bacterium]